MLTKRVKIIIIVTNINIIIEEQQIQIILGGVCVWLFIDVGFVALFMTRRRRENRLHS